MGKKGFLFVIILLLSSISHAQSLFRKGFIVYLNNDTAYGQLENRSNQLNYLSCKFKKDNEIIEYTVNEIKGFTYINDKCYTSGIVEGEFVEVLVRGYLQLFKYQSVFFIKKGTEDPIELESITKERNIDDENFFVPDQKWRGKLSYAIYDYFPNSTSLVNRLSLNEEDLSRIVNLYNKRQNPYYKASKSVKPWLRFDYGVNVGLTKTKLDIVDDQNLYPYLRRTYTSFDPTYGILLGISAPRFSERFSIQPEIHLNHAIYASLIHSTSTVESFYETHMEWTNLSLPISIKYLYPSGKWAFYLQVGYCADFVIKNKTSYQLQEIKGNVVDTYPEGSAFSLKDYSTGYWGGIGILREILKVRAGLSFRYYQLKNITENRNLEVNPQHFSVSLQIYRK